MNKKLVSVLFLIVSTRSAPTNLQLPFAVLPQMQQSPFFRPLLPNIQPTGMMYQQPQTPMIILMPNTAPTITDDRYNKLNEINTKDIKPNKGHTDEANEAIIIDAEHKPEDLQSRNAVVYLPNEGRYAIGTIISYIPFLPFEINVPDTISAIGSWISSIWSRPTAVNPETNTIKRAKESMPVIVMPMSVPAHF